MKSKTANLVFIAILTIVNLVLLFPLFKGEFTSFPLSIESVFLTEAKFVVENFPHIAWYPFWYFGLPFYLVYQPIPIFLTALISILPGISVSSGYRMLTAFFFVVGVWGVYFWTKYITKDKLAAFVSGIMFSFLPSIAYTFLSSGWRGYGLIPLRLVNAIVYGEGPHMWGLAFIPFACLYFQRLLRKPNLKTNWIVSLACISLILLTSLTAFVGLIVLLSFILFVEASKGKAGVRIKTSLVIAIFSFGLSLFWYNPAFISSALGYSLGDGGGILSGIWGNIVFSVVILTSFMGILGATYSFLNSKLSKKSFSVVLPLSLFAFLFIVIFGWFAWDTALFPLPFRTIPRLIPELELVFALFVGVLVSIFPKKLRYFLAGLVLIVALSIGFKERGNYWEITKPHKDFSTTSEYVISKKLEEIGAKRVYATGTHAFWMNLFNNSTQLRGGKGGDFGGLNPWLAHLSYLINKGEDKQLTEKWLRSLGVEYLVVNYPGSPVYYQDYKNLNRFSQYEEIFDYKRDKILKLPTENTSLAIALPKGWSENINDPTDLGSGSIVLDGKFIEKYFNSVEREGRKIRVEYPYKNSWSKMKIAADQVAADEEILIRQTYYPGWIAKSDSKRLKMTSDPIGFTLIINPGSEEIIIKYFPTSFVLSGLVSLITLVVFVIFIKVKINL